MVSNRRVLFLYKLEINRIERIYRFKRGTVKTATMILAMLLLVGVSLVFPLMLFSATPLAALVLLALLVLLMFLIPPLVAMSILRPTTLLSPLLR